MPLRPENAKSRESSRPFSTVPEMLRFGLFGRIVIALLLISAVPITIFGLVTYLSITSVGEEIVTQVFDTIDNKTRETMELQAVLTARSVSKFLEQRIADLQDLRELRPSENGYLQFSDQHKSLVWRRAGTNGNPGEEHVMLPLYREIAFIGADGHEEIKVVANRVVRADELRDVSDPAQTTYGVEEYFTRASRLHNGDIYVSHLTGFYVPRQEQLGDASSIEAAVEGREYDGVIRFATPIYSLDTLIGVVMLALDHRHLMELTQHILPNSKEETVFPVYSSGDYAFMFDDRGWIITHPKYWDLPGVDSSGHWMPPFTAAAARAGISGNDRPFNLDSAGHVHENYPLVARAVREGRSGSVITTNVGGIPKVMAYSPISFAYGDYANNGVFGGITIGAEIQGFRGHATTIAMGISRAVIVLRDNILLAILLTLVLSLIVSWLLSRSFARPIVDITRASQRLARGEALQFEPLNRSDEIGVLSHTFNNMAAELEGNRLSLLASMKQLEESKLEVENYARDLEYQLKVFRSIQRISNILGSTVHLDEVLGVILRRCVEGLGFDRAILYLIDDEGRYLACRETFGFEPDAEKLARRSQYNLDRFDCIETRVVKTGEAVFVEEFDNYRDATPLDRKIRELSRSSSFAFVPLKVKERIIGILGADKLRSGERVRQLDVNSLQVLANQAARVIENTRLYQQLIEQRNFVESIVHSMLNGVITIDPQGVVTSMNRAAGTILGIEADEVVGSPVAASLGHFSELREPIAAATHRDSTLSLHNVEISVAGETKLLTIHVTRLGTVEEGSPDAGAIIILADRTERKRLDDHLYHVERLASLGRFAAGIAHEIRNPVTGINVFLDDLHDKFAAEAEVSRLIERALVELERLETLVSEILDYASPSRGELSQRSLNDVVAATIRFVDKQCRESRITVESRLQEELPLVSIDSEKIRQALLNIILNAIQVMPDGGQLRLATRVADQDDKIPDSESNDSWLAIEIGDSGPGIADEEREQIFEPFYSKRSGGTGLGLSITQSIIAEHGGQIMVDGVEPHGTKFTIYLPITMAQSVQSSQVVSGSKS